MNTNNLPPYGFMEESIERSIDTRPVPEAWLALSGSAASAQYIPWRDRLIADLTSLLWPTYDFARQQWASSPNGDLIDADFELLKILHPKLKEPVKGLATHTTTHEEFFQEEDDEDTLFGKRYERYDPALPVHLRDRLTDILWKGCDRKMGSMHFQVKAQLQRPRPYQVALIEKRDFHYLWAKTGGTPAMVSGHCLQGATGGCSAWQQFGRSLDSASLEVFKQFTVDIGDRRVFAGVHYPSDNLSSWYTAFKLLPHVVESSEVASTMEFLWSAITTKSDVYSAIKVHIDANAGSPYRAAVDAIRKAAHPPVTGIKRAPPSIVAGHGVTNGERVRPT
jgi:hypothetical protein